jgi:hypothetical protein
MKQRIKCQCSRETESTDRQRLKSDVHSRDTPTRLIDTFAEISVLWGVQVFNDSSGVDTPPDFVNSPEHVLHCTYERADTHDGFNGREKMRRVNDYIATLMMK